MVVVKRLDRNLLRSGLLTFSIKPTSSFQSIQWLGNFIPPSLFSFDLSCSDHWFLIIIDNPAAMLEEGEETWVILQQSSTLTD
jgi:hypothetical protein